jgi:NAD(P)-dependent dehydrogenase (short-subunit alcohol dehydrogenase family)
MALKTVVITGCSTGFGRVTAAYLAERGWRVLATVRQETHRAELLAQAAARGQGERLIPLVCDITRPADVDRLAYSVAEYGPKLDALVNNAGTAFPGPLELLPLADVRAQLEVNLLGQLAVTKALLPALKSGRGTIINVSSVGGRVTFPMHGPYHMSKFALEAMSEVLRLELAHFGVKVVIVAPGSSPTPIWETSVRRAHASAALADLDEYAALAQAVERRAKQSAAGGFSPELFARTVGGVLNRRRPAAIYFVPRSAGLIVAARRLLPDWLWDGLVRRVLHW